MRLWGAVLVALVAGVALGNGLATTTAVDAAAWLSEWSRSAGFGGTAAIVAAVIAYRAAGVNARRQQWVDRKVQWWARANWALERVLSDDHRSQAAGLGVLRALAHSEWAGEHESDVVAAASSAVLQAPAAPDPVGCSENEDRPGAPQQTDSWKEVSDEIQTQEQQPDGAGGDAGAAPGGREPG